MTYVAYYGDRDEMEWVQGAPEGKEYSRYFPNESRGCCLNATK